MKSILNGIEESVRHVGRDVVLQWTRALALLVLMSTHADAAYCPENCDKNTIEPSEIPEDAPRFSDYPAKAIVLNHPASPDVVTDPEFHSFRTVIRAGAAEGPNFAGRYTLISHGCGTDCSAWMMADAVTGKTFDLSNMSTVESVNIDPILDEGQGLVRFQLDSRLVVVIGEINEDDKTRGISYFTWNGERLTRIRFVPHPYD